MCYITVSKTNQKDEKCTKRESWFNSWSISNRMSNMLKNLSPPPRAHSFHSSNKHKRKNFLAVLFVICLNNSRLEQFKQFILFAFRYVYKSLIIILYSPSAFFFFILYYINICVNWFGGTKEQLNCHPLIYILIHNNKNHLLHHHHHYNYGYTLSYMNIICEKNYLFYQTWQNDYHRSATTK